MRVERCVCRITQSALDCRALLLDMKVGDLEVLPEKFEGQPEKRLILNRGFS